MSALYSSKLLSREMIKRKSGCIINISSMLGVKGGRGCVTYATSKAGMIGKCLPISKQSRSKENPCRELIFE